jgi:copper homeostasis protein CutC
MPCGGINSENIVLVVRNTLAQEVHTSTGTSSPDLASTSIGISPDNNEASSGNSFISFEQKVAKLIDLLGSVPHDELVR